MADRVKKQMPVHGRSLHPDAERDRKLIREREKLEQRRAQKARSAEKKKASKKPDRERAAPEQLEEFIETCRRQVAEVRQPLALICQGPGFGGTLLRHLFDGHPQLHVHPYELHIGYPNKAVWPKLRPEYPPELWWSRLREESLVTLWHRGVRPGRSKGEYPFHLVPFVQRQLFLDAVAAGKGAANDRRILDAYFTSLFSAWLNNTNIAGAKRWVLACAPRITWGAGLERFLAAYPEGHQILMVRDPWSWFASERARASRSPPPLDQWRQTAEETIRAKAVAPDHTTIVSYDDLIGQTETTTRSLAGVLGIDWEPSLLVQTFNGQPIDGDAGSPDVTRAALGGDDVALVTERCGELFERVRPLAATLEG